MKKKIFILTFVGCMLLSGCSETSQEKHDDSKEITTTAKLINPVEETETSEESTTEKVETSQETEKSETVEETEPVEETELVEETEPIETETGEGTKTRKVGELTFNDELITEVTMRDMKDYYDYIKDVYIKVDERGKEINIVVQVPSATDEDTARMAGEDTARYLAACASWATDYYSSPGADDIGGIYDKYNLLIYIDDGNGTFNIYGAKVTSANKITWR